MPAKEAVAAQRRQPEGFAVRGGFCVHRLQGAGQDARARSTGVARDEDDECRRTHRPLAVRPVQPVCAAVAMLVSKVRERDLVGNCVPPEMTAAQARLEQLSDRTIREAKRWLDDDSQG
ncbi:hypothetical protein BFJ69_g15973 [Fusarium oxysporum]|uniref:Uncharacterized protein n=1 Tax=Fusarium oxysporum TaxID=5507 RepID=A0A420MCN4_FUSOX|nr:hypothetical protein BFJ69_g15973 [Fusarium oxysporum]